MNYAIQRKNMVESQVRPSDVTDRRIIRAMLELPREDFVPQRVRELAYMDGSVPLATATGDGRRALLAARTFAKIVQAAEVDASSAVLDVGAATGYSSAVLSRLAGKVVALECDGGLAAIAKTALSASGVGNVTIVEGDLARGWAAEGPYDAIIVEGAAEVVSPELLDQLKDGGRLVAISGGGAAGRATVWRRDGSTYGATAIFDAAADVLPGFAKARAFAF
ncbi:protein-L-isoaspartate O-methyltransferase [Hyphomicrobium sp.]|uniref:protein-L-isoaspartate O-methyltransferase family protein n=1 Tax=Hyphomicrobium sp. TaxID=82 RepID=UPI002E31F7BE|nr:protein-L-isoaspartate O-methyltransferase [Hyphomicrobium sp.]HEX2843582.1 protein-L-isoaspartate O-methyltransferase [Hyphomicrobium sp.]